MHALTRPAGALAALVFAAVGAEGAARGAPCGRPDLVDAVPPDGARDVAPNASLTAHYTASAEYLGEPVTLVDPAGPEQALVATFDPSEGLLTATPPAPLAAGGAYTVRWPALRGLNAAAAGVGAEVRFTVGSLPDREAPSFTGLTGARWDLERKPSDCTDEIVERFVFDLDLGPASDDGGRAGLTLLLFQTAGPAAAAGSVPVPPRAIPPAGQAARVALPVGDAVGRVCFAGLVRDLTGQVSNSGSVEACVTTTPPPFFNGCSLAPGRPAAGARSEGWSAAALGLALAALLGARGPRRAC